MSNKPNKPNKPIQLNPVQRPLTDEEKKIKVMQFLAQKREQFAVNIIRGTCNGMSYHVIHKEYNLEDKIPEIVDISVKMADLLLEKLYPLPEEGEK